MSPRYENRCNKCNSVQEYSHPHALKTMRCNQIGCNGTAKHIPSIHSVPYDRTVKG